jgi:pyruvate formate lyase activating enzyme
MHASISNLSIEPIEKHCFFHFQPGKKFLSVGFWGCNLHCPWCQNSSISQTIEDKNNFSAKEISDKAKDTDGIAFAFSEPLLHCEFIEEVSNESPKQIAVKTNGCVSVPTAKEISKSIDAANVDIKGPESYYRDVCGGSLKTVLDTLEIFVKNNVHVEISYLVNPDFANSIDTHLSIAKAITNLLSNNSVPLHILYCYPVHNETKRYDESKVIDILMLFREHFKYVYLSNVYKKKYASYRNTYCIQCRSLLVERSGSVVIYKKSCCGFRSVGV